MGTSEIMNLTKVCRSFPENPTPEINRDHLLDTIDKIFENKYHLVALEGPEGIGKTTLLAQFANRHPDHTLSLFIKPACRLAYASEYLALVLAEQIHWALNHEVFKGDATDVAFLQSQWPALQKRALQKRETYYIVIDGLDEIPGNDILMNDNILREMLPMGFPGFRFLISGDIHQFAQGLHKSVITKSFIVPLFSLDETERYLKDLVVERQSIVDVHRLCGGIPGHLACVKRSLQAGLTVKNILDEGPDNLPEFVALEWRKTVDSTPDQKRLLSVVAFGRKGYTVDEIGRLLSMEAESIREYLLKIGIVLIDEQTGKLNYISEAHRKYAADQLNDLRESVNNLLIDDLLVNADNEAALTYLPGYFEQAGRYNEMLNYLTPDHLTRVLENSHSLSIVRSRANLGLSTARKLNRDEALLRFSIQKAVLNEFNGAEIWRSEIKALMSLKEYSSAMALAQSAILKEDRLHLLATIARIKREHGLAVEDALRDQIRILYDQVDVRALGEHAVDVAADLMCTDSDLAIRMVEEAASTENDKDALDWALASLSLAAQNTKLERTKYADAVEKTRSRIKDPKVQRLSAAASVLFGEYSSADVIRHVDELDAKNRLYILRHWALVNESNAGAAPVVNYALDGMVKDTGYTPKMRDLRELATPLPAINDYFILKQLVGRFDSYKGSVRKLGTTEDYVRLQLLLARAESNYDFPAAHNRVMEIYDDINAVADLAVKTECEAWLAASLSRIDREGQIESKEGLQAVALEELRSNIATLLMSSADHYEVMGGVITGLVKARPEMAMDLAKSLNTRNRRDRALNNLIKTYIVMPVHKLKMQYVEEALGNIVDDETKDSAIVYVLNQLYSERNKLTEQNVVDALPLIDSIKYIKDSQQRCRACCYAYVILKNNETAATSVVLSNLVTKLHDSWLSINVGWKKVDTAFRIASLLAEASIELSREYLSLAENTKNDIVIDAEVPALAYLSAIRLAFRSFSGLLPRGLNKTEDLERLASLVNRIPSSGERACLWAELASRCFIANRDGMGRQIVSDHVRPLIADVSNDDTVYKNIVLIQCAPALYYAHKTTALELLKTLPDNKRDEAYRRICDVIFRKVPLGEPYSEFAGDGFHLIIDEAIDICELLMLMQTDDIIFHTIEQLADSMSGRHNKDRFTLEQKADVARRLRLLVDTKLPDRRNIQHDGYRIAAYAQIARIDKVGKQEWNELIKAGRKVPNVSDRALVLSMVATAMPTKEISSRNALIDEVMVMIEGIPTDLDRINRCEWLAEMLASLDSMLSRRCLKAAMELTLRANSTELVYESQKRIIDTAHRLDPSYAATLAALIDDDPARQTRKKLKQRIKLLEVKKKMAEQRTLDSETEKSETDYPAAAWMNLGGINAGKIEPLHYEFMRQYVEAAAELSIHEAYPILAWVIENAVKRYSNTDAARTILFPMFESTVLSAELAGRIAVRSLNQLNQVRRHASAEEPVKQTLLIKAGERGKAINHLKTWFEKNIHDYLKISDPYFGMEDLEILQLLKAIRPECKVYILTSKKHQESISQPVEDAFRTYWRIRISEQEPPCTDIVVVGIDGTGLSPIHDRWWLTNGGGFSVGTSFNALGKSKACDINSFSAEEAKVHEQEVNRYLFREVREHNNRKLYYSSFSL